MQKFKRNYSTTKMILGIHQPQYLPWLPFFLKIQSCDYFVFLDNVDYQKNGLQNRNQIKTNNGKLWLSVPVISNLGQKISDIKISNLTNWKKKHLLTIKQFYSKARSYNKYIEELESIYSNEWVSLCNLNISIIKLLMNWLEIKTPVIQSSELGLTGKSNDLIIKICKKLNATEYLSGTGAKNYIDNNLFRKNKIILNFHKGYKIKKYKQLFEEHGFIQDLSAIDIIFNCGERWKDFIIK